MSFLNPIFLLALLAVGLPLVIHLLNLRKPKRVKFSTIAFFNELKQTTIQKIKLKRWLLLALRFLAITCLAMVLARPFLPPSFGLASSANEPTVYGILVDNSISMSRIGAKGPLINQVSEYIQTISSSAKEEDRFLIQVTHGEALNSTVISAGQLEARVAKIEVQNKGGFFENRINELFEVLSAAPFQNKKIFVFTDGDRALLESIADSEHEEKDRYSLSVIQVEEVQTQNTFVSEISTPTSLVGQGIPFQLVTKVQNTGEVLAANQFLTLTVEGETVGQYALEIQPGETQTFSFEITPNTQGDITGFVEIEGDEFVADNRKYFSIQVPEERNVLWVTEDNISGAQISYTQAILDAQSDDGTQINYERVAINNINQVNLADFDAILLEGLPDIPEFLFSGLQSFVQAGKGLIFLPSQQADIQNYNDFLALFNAGRIGGVVGEYASFKSIAKANVLLEDHPILEDLFIREDEDRLNFEAPDIYYYYKLQLSANGAGFPLLELNNSDIILYEKKFGEGKLILSALGNDPAWSNFSIKPLYAPLFYRTLLYASSLEVGGLNQHLLGNSFQWTGDLDIENTELEWQEERIKVDLANVGGGVRVRYPGYEWSPGWVKVTDDEQVYTVALNLPNSESMFNELEQGGVKELIAENDVINIVDTNTLTTTDVEQEIKSSGFGKEIWQWFMLAGFLLLICESLVSTFYKAETIS